MMPQIQATTVAYIYVTGGLFLVDEAGNYILDENGNKIKATE